MRNFDVLKEKRKLRSNVNFFRLEQNFEEKILQSYKGNRRKSWKIIKEIKGNSKKL